MRSPPKPVSIGVLVDMPGEGLNQKLFERAFELGFEPVMRSGRFQRPWTLVYERVEGLPWGTAHSVEEGYAALDAQGVLGVFGPAISDNALIARDLADAARLPSINYSGSDATRSEYMFQFQVGSLEDEPVLLANHLESLGRRQLALVHDRSPIGERLASFFDEACAAKGLNLTARLGIGPLETDLAARLEPLRRAESDGLVYLGLGISARAVAEGLATIGWQIPVVCNSAGMFGRVDAEWARALDGWTYVDVVSDRNRLLAEVTGALGADGSSGAAVAYYRDMARLFAEGLARAPELTRDGLREGLERIKWLPSALGADGTMMGFGRWERGALKGRYVILRRWEDGRSVEVDA